MPTYTISGTISNHGANVAVNLTGTQSATTKTAADGTYSFSGIADLASWTVTPVPPAGIPSFAPTSKSGAIATADVTGVNFTGAAEQPIEAFSIPGSLFTVVDNGPAIETVPSPLAGVPAPNNPGAISQGSNVYPNGSVPDYLPLATTISFGTAAQPIKFKNPS